MFLLVAVMTCSVVFIVNINKTKSSGEETTDGGIEIEVYAIVNRRGEGRGGEGRGGGGRGGEGRGGEGRGDTASEIKMFNEREYEEITI